MDFDRERYNKVKDAIHFAHTENEMARQEADSYLNWIREKRKRAYQEIIHPFDERVLFGETPDESESDVYRETIGALQASAYIIQKVKEQLALITIGSSDNVGSVT